MPAARRRSAVVAVLVVVVGAALVVAAVGLSGRPSFALPGRNGEDPHRGRDWAFAIASFVVGLLMTRHAWRETAIHKRLTYWLVGAVAIVGPMLLLNINQHTSARIDQGSSPSPTSLPSGSSATAPTAVPSPTRSTRPGVLPNFDINLVIIPVAAVLLTAAIAIAAVAARRAWQRRPGEHVEPTRRDATGVESALDDAAEATALTGVPRDRVIAAYEAMESSLVRAGMRRERQQAPLEWLASLTVSQPELSGPANALTTIFERARFSTAPITEDDAVEAGALLRRIRTRLGVRV